MMLSLPHFKIRRARMKDVRSLADVQIRCWRECYRQIIDPGYLAALSHDRHAAMWARAIAIQSCAFVAEIDGKIVGIANGGRRRQWRLEKSTRREGELYVLYVLKQAHKLGIGRALFDSIHLRLAALGYVGLAVEVLSANPACIFYEHLGGFKRGTKNVEIGRQFLEESVYEWYD